VSWKKVVKNRANVNLNAKPQGKNRRKPKLRSRWMKRQAKIPKKLTLLPLNYSKKINKPSFKAIKITSTSRQLHKRRIRYFSLKSLALKRLKNSTSGLNFISICSKLSEITRNLADSGWDNRKSA
jgi:hypothetical protein